MKAAWAGEYRKRNLEKMRAKEKAYKALPGRAEQARERSRSYRKQHFFRWKAAQISDGLDAVTAGQLASLWKRQRGRCALTGWKLRSLPLRDICLDHVAPVSMGGSNGIFNLRWVSRHANEFKGKLTDGEMFQMCRSVLAFCESGNMETRPWEKEKWNQQRRALDWEPEFPTYP